MRILFICKHNIFRSRVAEILFNKLNKNKNNKASSAGLIKWERKSLKNDKGFIAEKKVAEEFGINLKVKSKGLSSKILKNTDILVIVADDVSQKIFYNEKSFKGKVIVWKIPDVKTKDKNKEEIARKTIKFIKQKITDFVN